MSSELSISLIICTKDREDDLLRVVASVLDQSVMPDELVIVDAGKGKDTESKVRALVNDRVPVNYIQSIPGLTRQRNLGIRFSSGNIVAFVDDDVVLDARYIEAILAAFQDDTSEEYLAVLSRIINYESMTSCHSFLDRIKAAFGKIASWLFLLPSLGNGRLKRSGFPSTPYHRTEPRVVECLSGGSMAFRHSVFDDIAFDEQLDGYAFMEDVDIARQIGAIGGKILYVPESQLAHYPSAAGRMQVQELARMSVLNHHYLFLKHSSRSLAEVCAFLWSLLGMLVLALPSADRRKGILDGIRQILATPQQSCIGSTRVKE